MFKLEDLTSGPVVDIDALIDSQEKTIRAIDKSSNLNMAVTAAALSKNPEGAVNIYRTAATELDTYGVSSTIDAILQESLNRTRSQTAISLGDVLADPNVTDEQKLNLVKQVNNPQAEQYSAMNMLSAEALAEPSGIDESARLSTQRELMAGKISAVNKVKKESQALLNAELMKEDPGLFSLGVDLLQTIAPQYSNVIGAKVGLDLDTGRDDTKKVADAVLLLGDLKMDLRKMVENTRPEDRLAITQKVIDVVNSNSSIVFSDNNEMARRDYLVSVLDQGGYDEAWRWVDNVVSVLDLVGIGSLVKGVTAPARASIRSVKTRVQPTTVSQNYKDTNPDKARAAHAAAVLDETGEAAEALYGASRDDVLANDSLAEIGSADGSVMNKISDPDRMAEAIGRDFSDELKDFALDDGAIYAFEAEKARARASVVNKLDNVTNLHTRKEMTSIIETGEGVKASMFYGPKDGGFESAETAINMAEFALRDLGVDQKQIKLMVRDGDSYLEATKEQIDALLSKDVIRGDASGVHRVEKDFLIKVDYDYRFSPFDIDAFEKTTTRLNFFDRVSGMFGGKSGSIDSHIFDAASRLDPVITKGAVLAENKSASIEKGVYSIGKEFSKSFLKASKGSREVMTKLITEANEKGIEHTVTQMRAAGLRDNEIKAMKNWRKVWDNIYHLENIDAGRSLKQRGFKEFVDKGSDSKLFAKPVAKQAAPSKVYDPTTGNVISLSKQQLDELYEAGGTTAKLRDKLVQGDEAIEHILVKNSANENFLKEITDNTTVLNYRKGYYSVHYKDPYFIRRKVKDSRGNVIKEETFATAPNKRQAEALARARAEEDGVVFGDDVYFSGDLKKGTVIEDEHMSLNVVRGRSAQKLRGKRLESADTNVTDPRQSNILDPIESLTASARSVARRTAYRNMLETTKARALKQFEEYMPKDKYGRPTWPSSHAEVAYRGGHNPNSKKLGDARTTYEYVRSLEDGYINAIDDSWKAVMNYFADVTGGLGLDRVSKGLFEAGAGRGPSAMSKNIAFQLYLALNPIRQFIVQGWQATQLFAVNPQWFLKGRAMPQTVAFMYRQLTGNPIPKPLLKGTGWSPDMAEQAFKAFEKGGHLAAVDRSNLVRGALMDMADQMNNATSTLGRITKYAMMPVNFSRKIGFDAGESVNKMTAFLSNYDQALVKGLDVSRSDVIADVSAKAENFIYNMNAAGDMPYNTNSLAVLFQFMQVPHKALLTMSTNRTLSVTEKAKLTGMNLALYGLPASAVISWFGEDGMDVLPKDGMARDAATQGILSSVFNKTASLMTGEKTNIDWSGLSPMDAVGSMDFIHSMLTTDISTLLTESPSGQLFFGQNPRITNWIKTVGRYTNVIDDYQTPTDFAQVAVEFARMGSGFSNAFKAAYAMEYDKRIGQYGQLPGQNVPSAEAFAIALGFESLSDARRRVVSEEIYNKREGKEADVKEWVNQVYKHLQYKNPEADDGEMYIKSLSEAWRVWGNGDYTTLQFVDKELRNKLANKDARLHDTILKAWYLSPEEKRNMAQRIKFDSEEQRQNYLEVINYMESYREEE